jgi:hypothetical protein
VLSATGVEGNFVPCDLRERRVNIARILRRQASVRNKSQRREIRPCEGSLSTTRGGTVEAYWVAAGSINRRVRV